MTAFASIEEFLRMGGHAPYVWACYGITLGVLVGLAIAPWRRQWAFERSERQRLLRGAAEQLGHEDVGVSEETSR